MKIKSHSLTPFSLTSLALCSALILPVSAKDDIVGTPDTDGDGDGDPVGDNVLFNVVNEPKNDGVQINQLGLASKSDVSTEYWVTSQSSNQWENYVVSPDTETNLAARVTQTLSPGDVYFYRQSSVYGFEEFTMRWRNSNQNLPSGTEISFGFGFGGQPLDIDGAETIGNIGKGETKNLSPVGSETIGGTTTPPTGYDGSLGFYRWYNYTIDDYGEDTIFDLKRPTFGSDPAVVGDVIWYLKFPDTIPVGEAMPAYTPWALSGFDKKGEFESVTPGDDYWLTSDGDETPGGDPIAPQNDNPTNDLVFSWTVDNKTEAYGPVNVNFLVPEPSAVLLSAVSMLALAFRRKRR